MAYQVEVSDEFKTWYEDLSEPEQNSVERVVMMLMETGPALGYPQSTGIKDSKFSHMRELRIQHEGRPYRVLYAFDPIRVALLLLGGDKTGDDRWYERMVPKADRLPREALIAITNSYFDGLTTHDGSIIMAHPGCNRLENGRGMTGAAAGRAGKGGEPSDCTSGLTNFSAALVAARRYPVVDEEAQAVLAIAVFVRRPGVATRRNVFSEWFLVDSNKIRNIYSAMFYPPPEQPVPNWPPYDGNWPLSLPPAVPPAPGK